MHTQGALVRHTYNLTFHYGVTTDSVMFTAMPFFWVGGLITGLHAVIHHGATLITQPAFDAAEALDSSKRTARRSPSDGRSRARRSPSTPTSPAAT